MPDDPNVIPPSRLARWILLALVLGGGVTLTFRYGLRLAAFGSVAPDVETTSPR